MAVSAKWTEQTRSTLAELDLLAAQWERLHLGRRYEPNPGPPLDEVSERFVANGFPPVAELVAWFSWQGEPEHFDIDPLGLQRTSLKRSIENPQAPTRLGSATRVSLAALADQGVPGGLRTGTHWVDLGSGPAQRHYLAVPATSMQTATIYLGEEGDLLTSYVADSLTDLVRAGRQALEAGLFVGDRHRVLRPTNPDTAVADVLAIPDQILARVHHLA